MLPPQIFEQKLDLFDEFSDEQQKELDKAIYTQKRKLFTDILLLSLDHAERIFTEYKIDIEKHPKKLNLIALISAKNLSLFFLIGPVSAIISFLKLFTYCGVLFFGVKLEISLIKKS